MQNMMKWVELLRRQADSKLVAAEGLQNEAEALKTAATLLLAASWEVVELTPAGAVCWDCDRAGRSQQKLYRAQRADGKMGWKCLAPMCKYKEMDGDAVSFGIPEPLLVHPVDTAATEPPTKEGK